MTLYPRLFPFRGRVELIAVERHGFTTIHTQSTQCNNRHGALVVVSISMYMYICIMEYTVVVVLSLKVVVCLSLYSYQLLQLHMHYCNRVRGCVFTLNLSTVLQYYSTGLQDHMQYGTKNIFNLVAYLTPLKYCVYRRKMSFRESIHQGFDLCINARLTKTIL